jgi:hypothetical protein
MKKLLISILLLMGIYGVSKPMEYAAASLTNALIAVAPTTLLAACYMVCGPDETLKERMVKSCKWIGCAAGVGFYAGLISPVPVCAGLLLMCTNGAIQLSAGALHVAASFASVAGFCHDIIHGHEQDFLSLYN